MRMVTGALMSRLAAGHRREEGNLACSRDHSIRLDMGMVDRGADHLGLLESIGIGLAACGEPANQVVDGAHVRRRIDGLFRLADPFAHPGEIFHLHPSSSSRTWWMPCRK